MIFAAGPIVGPPVNTATTGAEGGGFPLVPLLLIAGLGYLIYRLIKRANEQGGGGGGRGWGGPGPAKPKQPEPMGGGPAPDFVPPQWTEAYGKWAKKAVKKSRKTGSDIRAER